MIKAKRIESKQAAFRKRKDDEFKAKKGKGRLEYKKGDDKLEGGATKGIKTFGIAKATLGEAAPDTKEETFGVPEKIE